MNELAGRAHKAVFGMPIPEIQTKLCACCLSQEGPFVHLFSCSHLIILSTVPNFIVDLKTKYACLQCHRLLQKFSQFRHQVEENVQWLSRIMQETNMAALTTNRKVLNLHRTPTQICFSLETDPENIPDTNLDFQIAIVKEECYNTDNSHNLDIKISKVPVDFEETEALKVKSEVSNEGEEKSVDIKVEIDEFEVEETKVEVENKFEERHTEGMVVETHFVPNRPKPAKRPKVRKLLNKRKDFTALRKNGWTDFDETLDKSYQIHTQSAEELAEERLQEQRNPAYLKMDYKCESCILGFSFKATFEDHVKAKHTLKVGSAMTCDICQTVWDRASTLANHRARHFKRYKCVACPNIAKSQSVAATHHKTEHEHAAAGAIDKTASKYTCDHCKESFNHKSTLRSHILGTHFPEAMIKCPICNKSLRGRLERHIEYVHNKKQTPKNYICDHCGRAFSSSTLLRIHIRVHTGERPLSCPDCGATFAHPAALYTHKRLKHGKKPKRLET